MSVFISQSNELGADVLLIIFQHLNGDDLVNCEAVCGQWRDTLLTGTPWRRLFLRNKDKLSLWRKAQKKLESNQLTLRTGQYRDIGRKILQVDRNLRTGNLTTATLPLVEHSSTWESTINEDYVAWEFVNNRGCVFLDTESMEITELPLSEGHECFNEVFWRDRDAGEIEIVDPKNRWIVNALKEEEENLDHSFRRAVFGSKMLILLYDVYEAGRMIAIMITESKSGKWNSRPFC